MACTKCKKKKLLQQEADEMVVLEKRPEELINNIVPKSKPASSPFQSPKVLKPSVR